METTTHKPTIRPSRDASTRAYADFLVELNRCAACERWMLDVSEPKGAAGERRAFARYHQGYRLEDQMEAAGIARRSDRTADGDPVCAVCAAEGRAFVVCALCEQRRPSDQVEYSLGDPAEYLCRPCYETVPAKRWAEARDELYERHRYDYC